MKMSRKASCCDGCFEMIGWRSQKAAQLWVHLCEIYMELPLFGFAMGDDEELRILEILRFIVTTETKNMIMVKVLGHGDRGLFVHFCGGRCNE